MDTNTLTLKADRQVLTLVLNQLKRRKGDLIETIAMMIENDIGSEYHEKELHLVKDTIGKIEKVME